MSQQSAAARVMTIYGELDAMHSWRGWHWWPDADPFEVVVGSILVQNTAWANVERALALLREADALTPGAIQALSDGELESLVRPSGQYRQKARKLRAFLALVDATGSLANLLEREPASLRALLLGTWGIGEETADCIVAYAARQPAFVIDAYTKRVFTRLGMGPGESDSYSSWQQFFISAVPEDRDTWARFHALIVMHAKYRCRKRRPVCGGCTLAAGCQWLSDASSPT